MHGEEEPTYLHPLLEPIIGNTFGIIVYQEQIMQIASALFGYKLGEADLMRRAVSKKKEKELKKHRGIFIERGPKHGVDAETAAEIFDQIEFFANYGFNKSHAADYAVITCQTAFLKCHYPHEYMSALMSVYYDVSAKVSLFAADCERMGIEILPPNVNYSQLDFSIEPDANNNRHIRYGLSAVKNVGAGVIEHIIEKRVEGGRFMDIDDFLTRCDMRIVGKRALESMIRVGALVDLGDRGILLHNLERLMGHSVEHHKAADVGQTSLFDLFGDSDSSTPNAGSVQSMYDIPTETIDKREQLRWEKELLGFYVSDHPLRELMATLQNIVTHSTLELEENKELHKDKQVRVAGLVNDIRVIQTKKGDSMAIVTIEDTQGMLSCVMFPRTWAQYKDAVELDRVAIIRGKADIRRDEMQVIVEDVTQQAAIAAPELDEETRSSLESIRNFGDDLDLFASAAPTSVEIDVDDDVDDEDDDDTDTDVDDMDEPYLPPLNIDELEEPPEFEDEMVYLGSEPLPDRSQSTSMLPPPPRANSSSNGHHHDKSSTSNGHSNGHRNGVHKTDAFATSVDRSFDDEQEISEALEEPANNGRQRITILLERSGRVEADLMRVRSIYNIVMGFSR